MEPVESAQTASTSPPPVESAQVGESPNPVTAAGSTPVENATPPQQQTQGPPQSAEGGQTAAGVDESEVNDYQRELDQFLSANPPDQSVSSLESMASPADLAAQGIVPKQEEPPATPPVGTPASTPPPVVTTAAVPPVPEDDLEPATGKQPRFNNVRAVDALDVRALSAYKAALKSDTLNGMTMVDFMADFKAKMKPAAPAPTTTTEPPETGDADAAVDRDFSVTPQSVAELDAMILDIIRAKGKKNDAFEWEASTALEIRQKQLENMRAEMVEDERVGKQQQANAIAASDQKALTQVGMLFPQAMNPADPLVAKFSEIVDGWKESGDPRMKLPNRYLYAYMEAADAMGIQPSPAQSAPVTSAPTSTPAPVNRPPTSAILASGGARDIPRAPVSSNLDDYEAEVQAFLAQPVRPAAAA